MPTTGLGQIRSYYQDSQNTATIPDQYGVVVQRARNILQNSQPGLIPKASAGTSGNTNVAVIQKNIAVLSDLVTSTNHPVWKENYRMALVRNLAAYTRATGSGAGIPADTAAIAAAGLTPDTYSHPAVGIVSNSPVGGFVAIQAAYQHRFNPPPPPPPQPGLPLDVAAQGSEYSFMDIPGLSTTAMRTPTNPSGSYVRVRGEKPLGVSYR